MQRVSDGYTIIEVMIFLGVSAVIAGAAMSLISGKQSETEFNQKVRDTQSKIQDVLNDVSTGNSGGNPTTQTCAAPGSSRPVVKNTPPGPTYDPECIFLGKAIQFTDASNSRTNSGQDESLYIYSVFGRRTSASTGELPTNMSEASPDAAVGKGGSVDLTETFSLSPAHVKSVCAIPQGSNICNSNHLFGFMNSFNYEQNTALNGSEDLNVYLYDFNGNDPPANDPGGVRVQQCLQGSGSCSFGTDPTSLKSLTACLTDGRRSAQLTISSSGGVGASTRLDYTAC
jgi:type II secretory pathway pseudopilin PulG